MNPGAIARPVQSITRPMRPTSKLPTATIRSPRTATSPIVPADPLPSKIVPPLSSRSASTFVFDSRPVDAERGWVPPAKLPENAMVPVACRKRRREMFEGLSVIASLRYLLDGVPVALHHAPDQNPDRMPSARLDHNPLEGFEVGLLANRRQARHRPVQNGLRQAAGGCACVPWYGRILSEPQWAVNRLAASRFRRSQ